MQNKDAVHGASQDRVDFILIGRRAEHQAKDVFRIRKIIVWVRKWLAQRILVGIGTNCWHFCNQTVGCNHALHRVGNIGAVVVESRQRPYYAYHDGHGMGTAHETAVKAYQLFMQHGVLVDIYIKF